MNKSRKPKGIKKPLVSVIIPVYNGALFLKEAVESVFKNTFQDFELILVNDGSTDKSKTLCRRLQNKYSKIKFYSFTNNRGLSNSLNFAISKAKGKYIARLNQDDLMTPDRLEKQVEFLENNPHYVIVGGALELFNSHGKAFEQLFLPLCDEDIRNNWLTLNCFADPAVTFQKVAFEKTNGYSQIYYPADDYQLWYKIAKYGKIANLNQVVTRMRIHKKAATIKLFKKLIKNTWKLHFWSIKHVQNPDLPTLLFWFAQYFFGMLLPVEVNFFIYRFIKKAVFFKSQLTNNFFPKNIINRVNPHPKKLSFSGQ